MGMNKEDIAAARIEDECLTFAAEIYCEVMRIDPKAMAGSAKRTRLDVVKQQIKLDFARDLAVEAYKNKMGLGN